MNLNQVTIPSVDLVKSVDFYKLLGLRLIVDSVPKYARFECLEGESTFSVHQVNELPKGDGVVVYFETKYLDTEVKRLRESGVKFDLEPTDQSWMWREARLKDPDGNQLILFYAGDARKNPPWRLKHD